MHPLAERLAIRQVTERLAELLGAEPAEAVLLPGRVLPEADAILNLGGLTFVIEWKPTAALAGVSVAARQVRRRATELSGNAIPLVAVRFMGPAGAEHCRQAGVAWLDLSGNAHVVAPGIRIEIGGQPNRFRHPGRPSSVFAPKSARIARWLLQHPRRSATQREIARETNMDEGFTSRIVARLEQDSLIVREADGTIRASEPDLLLDAWQERYDFSKHEVSKGHVAVRSGEGLVRQLAGTLRDRDIPYAATGLAGAWLLDGFAGFRIATVFVAARPTQEVLDSVGFLEGIPGENVWIVIPNDEGVFHGASDRAGVRCVHPVQAYLDLKGHPERASEAAARLRARLLTWKLDG